MKVEYIIAKGKGVHEVESPKRQPLQGSPLFLGQVTSCIVSLN